MSGIMDMVHLDTGLVDCAAYSPEVYVEELDRVFGRTWIFVGHVAQVPRPGDFVTGWIGETPVALVHGGDGAIRGFVNRCATSQRPFLAYDAGHLDRLTCPAHRRGYDTLGRRLGSEPADDAACLTPVPRLSVYGGLVFGSLAGSGETLEEHLGEARWYLDNYVLREDIGGLQLLPGVQRYRMPGNWKLLAENFAGDDYHVAITHASVLSLRAQQVEPRIINSPGRQATDPIFSVATGYRHGVPHGLLEVRVGDDFYNHDLMRAQTISPRAVDWVNTRKDAVDRRLAHLPAKPYSFHVGNLFPTFSIIGNGTSLEAVGLLVWHPRGPNETAVTQLGFVDAGAPLELQEQMAFALSHQQAAAGVFAPDDHENFERLAKSVQTAVARTVPFNYEMGLADEGRDVRPPEWQDPAWPGLVLPRFTELIQRDFYRYWMTLMTTGAGNGA
ncbi:MAG: Rieske 2Fe-2S domain-containing protein [Actinobacteria bacterium]|jgi:phenylpropionate dioxygenase-like ring-hydroxylating dioxygenase large terminal subunit|nr:Rieske 2Fe-2S domain-containing protein [Actinomycetota bacterium]